MSASQYAEALWLNEDLAIFTLMRTNLVAVCVVGANEPLAVPACRHHCLVDAFHGSACTLCLLLFAAKLCDLRIFFAVFDEHATNEDGLGYRSFRRSEGLEGFAGMLGETVQVQAIVPVGTADQRKIMRAEMADREVERAL